jgi:hypothetical protein
VDFIAGMEAFEKGNLLSLLVTDPRSFLCTAPSLVAIPTELSRALLISAIWLSRFLVAILALVNYLANNY